MFSKWKQELQIVACGVVSIEDEENWSWFLNLILKYLMAFPAFIISDQDKGLLPALAKVSPEIMHFYGFQHLMEKFNKKFNCKKL